MSGRRHGVGVISCFLVVLNAIVVGSLAAVPAAAQSTRVASVRNPADDRPLLDHLRLVAPAAPGGGWDQTARVMQQVLQQTRISRTTSVENIPGAAGTIGLARFVGSEQGNGDVLMVSGLIMLGGVVMHRSPVTLHDVTPIARITGEYEAIVVPARSPFRTLEDVVRALRDRPEAVSWGGGSAGGSDQILAGLIAEAVGVSPRRLNYIAFSGGGESLSAILGGQVSVGVNGLAELEPQIEAGTIRALAVSSAERLPGLDVATLVEQGVNVEFENWRSVVAPAGLSADEGRRLRSLVESMVRTAEWRAALTRYRWLDRYLSGDDFARFADREEKRVRAILDELGTGDDDSSMLAPVNLYPALVLAGLALSGVALIAVGRVSPFRVTPPAAVRPRLPRAIWWIASALVLNLVMAESAGFVLASTALFWLTARAFDDRHPIRDGLFALGVSLCAWFVFARLLHLTLP